MVVEITPEQYQALLAEEASKQKRNKYGAIPVRDPEYGYFASTLEHQRWHTLLQIQQGGFVRNLRRQVSYDCIVGGVKVCRYVADFVYQEWNGELALEQEGRGWENIVEDAKGKRTEAYKITRQLMLACFGIRIKETGRGHR